MKEPAWASAKIAFAAGESAAAVDGAASIGLADLEGGSGGDQVGCCWSVAKGAG